MSKVALVIVSDIHAGPDHPFPSLRTAGKPEFETRHHSTEALVSAVQEILVKVAPDHVGFLCAGDLSTGCLSSELQSAGKFLTTVADGLSISPGHRILVPGNHDIDWKLTTLAAEHGDEWYDKYRQRKFADVMAVYAPSFRLCSEGVPQVIRVFKDKLSLVILDSPFEDRSNTKPHHGRLGERQMDQLRILLDADGSAVPKIAMLHHHITPYGRGIDAEEYSLLTDAAEFVDVLSKNGVQVVIHGHQHRHMMVTIDQGHSPVTIIGAGSTTAQPRKLAVGAQNSFHVLVIDEIEAPRLEGFLHSRILTALQGWHQPVYQHHNISAARPFGGSVSPSTVSQWASEAISVCDKRGFVKLKEFLSAKPSGARVWEPLFQREIRKQIEANGRQAMYEFAHNSDKDMIHMNKNEGV